MGERIYLGLDIGTRCGWCRVFHSFAGVLVDRASYYDLGPAFKRGGSVARWAGYRALLGEIMRGVDATFFEDVPGAVHTGGKAARVHGGLRATLELYAADEGMPLQGVSIQAAKRALAGTAAASKKMMRNAARGRFGVLDPTVSGDVADALGVVLAGIERLGSYQWAKEAGLCSE